MKRRIALTGSITFAIFIVALAVVFTSAGNSQAAPLGTGGAAVSIGSQSVAIAPQGHDKPEAAGTDIVTQWTFELSNTLPAIGSGTAISGPTLAGQAFFAGNNSTWAWSLTTWSTSTTGIDANKYIEFDVSTAGYTQIGFRFDDRRSGTGPASFQLHYSTDGTTFTPFYTGTGHTTFFTNTFDLSGITALEDNPNVRFRIYGYGATSTAGTWRFDNVTVFGVQVPVVDLGLSKSGPDTAIAGETITYTINLSNTGNYTAAGTLMTDTLPTEVSFVTYTTALPVTSFTQNGQDLSWDLGDVAPTTNAFIAVQVVVSSSVTNGTSFTNTVEATTTYTETTLANNTATAKTFIGSPDLAIVKTGPASVNAGDTFTYTLTYSNAGTINATGVEIVDQLPAGVTFVTETNGSAVVANGQITWTVGALNAGAGSSIDVGVAAVSAGEWVNTATISGGPVDSDLLNNTSSVTTTINGADPYVLKSGPAAAFVGQQVLYTLTYGNHGNIMATATLTDQLPISFTVADIAVDNSGLAVVVDSGDTRAWTVDIAPNSEVSFTLALTVPTDIAPTTHITNVLSISAVELGDNPIDNAASASSTVYQIVPIATARAGAIGQGFAIEGTVTVEPGVFTYQGQNRYMYIQDATGGVLVYRTDGLNSVARSHVVRAIGTIDEYKAETEFLPADAADVIDLGPGMAVTPLITNTGAIDEQVEGQLVQISGRVEGTPAAYRLQVNDGSGMVEVNRYYNLGTVTDPNYIDFAAYSVGDYVKVVGVTRGYSETFGFTREVVPRGPVDIAEYPRVLSVAPVSNATGVPITTTVQATFNLTLTNVASATFTVADATGAISGTVSYDPATQTAAFTPDADLAYGTRYTVTLKSALAAENGLTLMPAQDYMWSFVTYQPTPQLALAKGVDKPASEMQPGDVVTYTLELSNSGDAAATGVMITDVLPVEVTFGGFVQQNSAAEVGGTITWSGSLNAGVTATVIFTATVGDQRAFYGRTVTNIAQFTSDNGGSDSAEADFQIANRYFILLPLVQR